MRYTLAAIGLFTSTFGSVALAQQTANGPYPLRWHVYVETDKLDGRKTQVATLPATFSVRKPHRQRDQINILAALRLDCNAHKPSVYFSAPNTLIAGISARVSYRFEKNQPIRSQRWDATVDNVAVGISGQRAKDFLKMALSSSELFIRIEDDAFGEMEATFYIPSAGQSLDQMRKDCRW